VCVCVCVSARLSVCACADVCVCTRVSEGSTLCPEWKDLQFPDHAESYNSAGVPKYVGITYRDWKGRPLAEKGLPHVQYLHGNPRNVDYCSVVAMMKWYVCQHVDNEGRVIELRDGPIFGNFNPQKGERGERGYLKRANVKKTVKVGAGTSKCEVWYGGRELKSGRDENSNDQDDYTYTDRVNFTEESLRSVIYSIFDVAADIAAQAHNKRNFPMSETRLRAATCHTLRATCVAWAARSKSPNAFIEAKLTGRWVDTSKVFRTYWSLGSKINERLYGVVADPLHKFKPWPQGGSTIRPYSSAVQRASALLFEGSRVGGDGGVGEERVRRRGATTAAEEARRAAARRRTEGLEEGGTV